MTLFTLAEVLIVLGIIGLIADMTIPTLVGSFRKQAAATSLRKFYTNMSQALMMSEAENGASSTWEMPPSRVDASETEEYFNKYLAKYFRVAETKHRQYYIAASGPEEKGTCIDIIFDYNDDKKPNTAGRDQFPFIMYQNATREEIISECISTPAYCTRLIEFDGWSIAKDYPYKF